MNPMILSIIIFAIVFYIILFINPSITDDTFPITYQTIAIFIAIIIYCICMFYYKIN